MYRRGERGWIEVIAGPMFSGKSEELIRRLTRYKIAGVPMQAFKPKLDNRYAEAEVVSHSDLRVDAEPVANSDELLRSVREKTVIVGVDEGQFFDEKLVDVCEHLASLGKQIIIAGLDLDFMGRPFGSIPTLMTRAEYVSKMLSVCHRCGGPGMYTQRVIESDELVVLGATDSYESRCRYCYDPTEAMQEHLEI